MENKIVIVPGESVNEGSANIRYPDGQILNVKGFYEQDSHVMPKLNEVEEDGLLWEEYVPEGLDLTEKHPLIISWHGGGQSGWGQCFATGWTFVADKYGLVVFFPNHGRDTDDIAFTEKLIGRAKEAYNIDDRRVFIQGMSAGNMMTSRLSRGEKAEWFAGAGMSAGPDNTMLFEDPDADLSAFKPVPVYQSRGERDTLCPSKVPGMTRHLLNKSDRDFWLKVDGCEKVPSVIAVSGRNNWFVYKGTKADVIYRDVKRRGHGQTIDDAEKMWRQYFSGLSRAEDGSVVMGQPIEPLTSDKAVIFADGAKKMFVDSSMKEMKAASYEVMQYMEVSKEMLEHIPELADPKNVPSYGPFMYVAADDIADAFGFKTDYSFDGQRVVLSKEGLELQFAAGNVASTVNGVLENLERQAEYKDGVLYLPMRSVADFMGLNVIYHAGVIYVTDHTGELTDGFAAFLKEYLLG